MANLLILDASSSLCSVTLLNGEQRHDLSETQPRRHAQRLLPMVDEVLQLAGLPKAELDGIAYARGPGSFTGIRIAVSVVQGIAMGLDIPVYGFSTLQMLAQQSAASLDGQPDRIVSILDAHMGEVFWGVYQRQDNGIWTLVGDEHVGAPDVCAAALAEAFGSESESNWCLAGNGVKLLPETMPVPTQCARLEDIEPLCGFATAPVQAAWQQQLFGELDQYPPVYLRDSVAWKKLDEQPSLLKR